MIQKHHKKTILHIIASLGTGGAESMLYKILRSTLKSGYSQFVIVMMDSAVYGPRIRELGIPVYSLGMRQGLPSIRALHCLRKYVIEVDPSLIVGWMYHGNFAAAISRHFLSETPAICWNVRQTLYSMTEEKWLTKRIIKYCAGTSSIPARIIYNSRISARQHQAIGFADSKTTFIANGFDTNEFRPNAESREAIYDELKIDKTHMLVGTIARNHPMKNYAALIESAIIVLKDKPAAIFVLVGPGTDDPSSQLMKLIEAHGLQNNFRCLGERHDVQRILAALTLFVLPSAWGEGFPNVVGEAMSSEVPCIVTNVGESAAIVDQNGVVVQPCDIVALADSIKYMLSKSTAELTALGRAARQRIIENYSLPEISAQYLQVYSDALRGKSEQLAKS